MAIIVCDVSNDDLQRACDIEGVAYASNPLSPVLFPGPFPPESRNQRRSQLIEIRNSDPTVKCLQAYDEEKGQLVAFAKWHIYDTPEAAVAAERPSRTWSVGANRKACEAFFGGLSMKKKALMGDKPHLYLHMLHTDPAFQGRGAGGLLIAWGTKMADELGLPAYLESSLAGYGLYKRHGFREVDVLDLDLTQFGGTGVYHEPLMLREPNKSG